MIRYFLGFSLAALAVLPSAVFAQLTAEAELRLAACSPLVYQHSSTHVAVATTQNEQDWWNMLFDFAGCNASGNQRYRYGVGEPRRATMQGIENLYSDSGIFTETQRDTVAYTPGYLGNETTDAAYASRIRPYLGLRVEASRANRLFDGGRIDKQDYTFSGRTVEHTLTDSTLVPTSSRAGESATEGYRGTRVVPDDAEDPAGFSISLTSSASSGRLYAWSFSLMSEDSGSEVSISVDGGPAKSFTLEEDEWADFAISPAYDGDNDTEIEVMFTGAPQGLIWERGQLEQRTRNDSNCATTGSGTFAQNVHNNSCIYLPAASWLGEVDISGCGTLSSGCFAEQPDDILSVELDRNSHGLVSGDHGTIITVFRPRSAYLAIGTGMYWASNATTSNFRNTNWRVAGSPYQFQAGTHDASAALSSNGLNVQRDPFHSDDEPASGEENRDLFLGAQEIGDVPWQYRYDLPWQLESTIPGAPEIGEIDAIVQDRAVNIMAFSWDYRDEENGTRRVAFNGGSRKHTRDFTGEAPPSDLDQLYFGIRPNGVQAINGDVLMVLINDRICSQAALEQFTHGDFAEPDEPDLSPLETEAWCEIVTE